MKTKVTLFFFLSILCMTSFAQNWFEGSPSWYYEYDNQCLFPQNGWDKIYLAGDTILNGQACKKLTIDRFRNDLSSPDSWTNTLTRYIYEEDDKVYFSVGFDFHLIYDFTLEAGDAYTFPYLEYDFDPFLCDSVLTFSVLETGNIDINGTSLRFQQLQLSSAFDGIDSNDDIANFMVIEKVGAIGHNYLDFPANWRCFIDVCNAFDFGCYRNDALNISYPEENACDELTSVEQSPKLSLKVHPNPTTNVVFVESNEIVFKEINLYNTIGVLVRPNLSNKIDMSNLPNGIYLLQLIDQNDNILTKKIIKQGA